jgi:DNA-binding MarR family transcriptional regulator
LKKEISELREALLDITGVLNRPQPDAALIEIAGVKLDRALFPLLVRVERRGPLAVGELAELCGRNYTTVSRQIAQLDEAGLITREDHPDDARVTQVSVTPKGRRMTHALDGARAKVVTAMLADWNTREVAELARLLRKLADGALEFVRQEKTRSRK